MFRVLTALLILSLMFQPIQENVSVLDCKTEVHVLNSAVRVEMELLIKCLKGEVSVSGVILFLSPDEIENLEVRVNDVAAEFVVFPLGNESLIQYVLSPPMVKGEFRTVKISFVSNSLTSKVGKTWSLFFTVLLPSNASTINVWIYLPESCALKSSCLEGVDALVSIEDKQVKVFWREKNSSLVRVGLTYEEEWRIEELISWEVISIALGLIGVLIGVVTGAKMEKRKSGGVLIPISCLPPVEASIMRLIAEKGGATQAEISRELRIPKSSLSRLLDSMERRELVKRIPLGSSKIVVFGSRVVGAELEQQVKSLKGISAKGGFKEES